MLQFVSGFDIAKIFRHHPGFVLNGLQRSDIECHRASGARWQRYPAGNSLQTGGPKMIDVNLDFSGLQDIARRSANLSKAENNKVLRDSTRAGAEVLRRR